MRDQGHGLSRRRVLQGGAAGALLLGGAAGARAAEPTQEMLEAPGGRAVPLWRWKPNGARRGAIAFSHGAQSAPWKYRNLLQPWADAGYEILAPLHVDSTDHPRTKEFPGSASWKARIEDMRAVSAAIPDARFLAAGHSYGALTALTMGGAEAVMPDGLEGTQRQSRVAAVVAFSPPAPIPTLIPQEGYARIAVPALIQTGDQDVARGATDPAGWRGHLAAYEAAPTGGDRYALVLAGVDHYFGGLICREIEAERQTAQLGQAIALSTLFIDAFLRGDAKARAGLNARRAASGPVQLLHK